MFMKARTRLCNNLLTKTNEPHYHGIFCSISIINPDNYRRNNNISLVVLLKLNKVYSASCRSLLKAQMYHRHLLQGKWFGLFCKTYFYNLEHFALTCTGELGDLEKSCLNFYHNPKRKRYQFWRLFWRNLTKRREVINHLISCNI